MTKILALIFLPAAPIVADLLLDVYRNLRPRHRSDNELIEHLFNQHR